MNGPIRASGISVCFNGFNYLQRPDKLEALIIFFGRRAVLARQNSESRRSLMRGGGGGAVISQRHSVSCNNSKGHAPTIIIYCEGEREGGGEKKTKERLLCFYRYGNPCPVMEDPTTMPPIATIACFFSFSCLEWGVHRPCREK